MYELGYYSKGLFNFESAYRLPVVWRNHVYKWLANIKEKEKEAEEEALKGKGKSSKFNMPEHMKPIMQQEINQYGNKDDIGTIKKH